MTSEELTEIKKAIKLICSSEEIAQEFENANHHSDLDFLESVGRSLHVHDFSGE